MPFVHLINHSNYSLLRSTIRVKNLVQFTKKEAREGFNFDDHANMRREKDEKKRYLERGTRPFANAVALTDLGNMFGALDFYFTALNSAKSDFAGIKPILGCELKWSTNFPQADTGQAIHAIRAAESALDTVVLLAENESGYHNLIDLVSQSFLLLKKQPKEIRALEPIVSLDLIREKSDGLIALYGGRRSSLATLLAKGKEKAAQKQLELLRSVFKSENLFVMLQDHGAKGERKIVEKSDRLARQLGLSTVVTNDNHYLQKEDLEAWKIFCGIETGKLYEYDPAESGDLYTPSIAEMEERFKEYPEALMNSVRIADRCNVVIESDVGDKYWPVFPLPEGYKDADEYLAHLTWERAPRVYPQMTEEQRERLSSELSMMKTMHVASYMLIVQDFINWAREHGVPVGPGRGSAAGSAVAYVLGITKIDPLRFGLIFERFLNPERVSMPDIDTDFSDLGRIKVINYVREKYGDECVAQIITYGRLKAKAVLKDVGRILQVEAKEMNDLTKLIPDRVTALVTPQNGKSKSNVIYADEVPEVVDAFIKTGDQRNRSIWKYAVELEGLVRQAGIHAAAVIIAPEPLHRLAPIYCTPDDSTPALQYDKTHVEDVGFLKMDFLGLRTLSVISSTVEMVKENRGIEIDIDRIDLSDAKTYAMLGRGHSMAVFQFESPGMSKYLRKLRPTCIEDLIAMNALYRPGPMQFIPQYIQRKNGEEAVDCYHPDLEPILGETYGVIVYQEQVMRLAQKLSGFSLGGADQLRRAMSKKKGLENYEKDFIGGAVKNGYSEQLARQLWEVLIPFSEYAFNKSHAAAYSFVAFQTAYLKAHYPQEFMAANLTTEFDKHDRLAVLLQECRALNIEIIPPNINVNLELFTVLDGKINYGLAGIRNVGLPAAAAIVDERKRNGPFLSIYDLTARLSSISLITQKALECLVMAGALDVLQGSRAEQYATISTALQRAKTLHDDRERGFISLFDSMSDPSTPPKLPLVSAPPWSSMELLAKEKDVLGSYISSHPLEMYQVELRDFCSSTLAPEEIAQLPLTTSRWSYEGGKRIQKQKNLVVLGGLISEMKSRMGANSTRPHGTGKLSDQSGSISLLFWPEEYAAVQSKVGNEEIVLIEGTISQQRSRDGDASDAPLQIVGERVWPLESAVERLTKKIHLQIDLRATDETLLMELAELLEDCSDDSSGSVPLYLHVITTKARMMHSLFSKKIKVLPTKALVTSLATLLGGIDKIKLER